MTAAKKSTSKKSTKKAGKGKLAKKKSAQKAVKKTAKKAVKKSAKKSVKKSAKKAVKKKSAKKSVKKVEKKNKKASKKKAVKKTLKKSSNKKRAKKSAKKCLKKTAVKKKSVRKKSGEKVVARTAQKAPEAAVGRVDAEKLKKEGGVILRGERSAYPTDNTELFEIESKKFDLEAKEGRPEPQEFVGPPRELDPYYGETGIYVLVRDPEWVYVYWEISGNVREQYGIPYGHHNKHLVLRFHDITDLEYFDGSNAHQSFDVDITDDVSAWYQHMPKSNRVWCAEFGIKEEGGFTVICRSHNVHIPPLEMAPEDLPLEWVFVDPGNPQRIFRIPAGASIREILGSANIAEEILKRLRLPKGMTLEEKRKYYESLVGQELSSYLLSQPPGAPSADLSSWILTQRQEGSEFK